MRTLETILMAIAIGGCQSVIKPAPVCNLNGYSFCVNLPPNLRFTNESRGPDFVIFSSSDFGKGYGVYFYEGNYAVDNKDVKIIDARGNRIYGEVEYRVDIISTPDTSYSVLLSRLDGRFPNAIRVFTDYKGGEKAILEQVLVGIKGCASVEFFEMKCDL